MALSEIYVDPALAGDTGRGTRMTATLSAATFTFAGLTLNETNAFTAYNTLGWASGDRIYLTGGTAVTVGWHTIASVSSNSEIVMAADITTDSSSPTDVTAVSAPYGDLEYAIEQTTFDTTNGTRVNILTGTDEILAVELGAALDDTVTAAAWVPSEAAPCIFQGYTTTAGDGGVGGISGGASVSVINSTTKDYIHFVDLHCHNTGANTILQLDNFCSIIGCEFDNSTVNGIQVDLAGVVVNNYVHNIGAVGIDLAGSCICSHNYLENGTNDFTDAIKTNNTADFISRNIIKVDGTSDGILINTDYAYVSHNSIWSNAGTGSGIIGTANRFTMSITNNLVEGFSGVGGVGYELNQSAHSVRQYGGNSSYDNTAHYSAPTGYVISDLGDNETLSATPFTSASTGDFSPVDTGNVKEGALPADFGTGQ